MSDRLVDKRFKRLRIKIGILRSVSDHGSAPLGQRIQSGIVDRTDLIDEALIVELRQSSIDIRAVLIQLGCDVRRDVPALLKHF